MVTLYNFRELIKKVYRVVSERPAERPYPIFCCMINKIKRICNTTNTVSCFWRIINVFWTPVAFHVMPFTSFQLINDCIYLSNSLYQSRVVQQWQKEYFLSRWIGCGSPLIYWLPQIFRSYKFLFLLWRVFTQNVYKNRPRAETYFVEEFGSNVQD